jgi:hypothetical protein
VERPPIRAPRHEADPSALQLRVRDEVAAAWAAHQRRDPGSVHDALSRARRAVDEADLALSAAVGPEAAARRSQLGFLRQLLVDASLGKGAVRLADCQRVAERLCARQTEPLAG